MQEGRKAVYRQAITEAAERVFAEKGTGASRMQEIAAAAGISLGTLYGVIDGKESLFHGIHRIRMDEFLDRIRDASRSHEDTLQRTLAVVREGARYFLERPDFLRMCCRDGYAWSTPVPASSPGRELWNDRASIPRELFARGIDEGVYVEDDPDLLVRKMLALKQAELTHWVEQGMKTPHDEILERITSQFLRAFCTRAAQGPAPTGEPT